MSQGLMGLSADTSTATTDSTATWKEYPSWCSWMPFADFMEACQIQSETSQIAAQTADLETYTCANATDQTACVQSTLDAAAATTAAAGSEDASGKCQAALAASNPTLSALFGVSNLCSLTGNDASSLGTVLQKYALYAALGIGGLWALTVVMKRQ
jgi:hypothetical protein